MIMRLHRGIQLSLSLRSNPTFSMRPILFQVLRSHRSSSSSDKSNPDGSTSSTTVTSNSSIVSYIKGLVHNKEINTIPNIITMSRIVSSPLLTLAIVNDMKTAALCGCLAFAVSDWLDGYLAEKLNQKTVLGAFLDPVADKVFIAAVSVGLVWEGLLPLPLAGVIIGRDVALIAASFALRAMERPSGARFFDTTDSATFKIIPSDLSKINTGIQFALLSTTLLQFTFDAPSVAFIIEPLWWITATTTISSGLLYLNGSGIKKLNLKKKK